MGRSVKRRVRREENSGRFMTSRWCSGCGFGRRWTVAGEFTGEELSGERRQWRRGFLALGGNGEEGVGCVVCVLALCHPGGGCSGVGRRRWRNHGGSEQANRRRPMD